MDDPLVLVLMGVSGCGKSTVAGVLAGRLHWDFEEGDVHLAGSREVIAARLARRHGHYMPTSLLDSQFADLEPPGADERALTIDVADGAAVQADEIVHALDLEQV